MTEDERNPEELSFEEAMESLDSIVGSLEGERLPLEEMVTAYERGMKLLRVCRTRIDSARQRVELITADLEGKSQATLSEFASKENADPVPATVAAEETAKRPARKKPAVEDESDDEIRLF